MNTEVKPGQIWEDCDWRSAGRKVRVLSVTETHALVANTTDIRRTRIRLDRMKPGSTGYRLVKDTDQ